MVFIYHEDVSLGPGRSAKLESVASPCDQATLGLSQRTRMRTFMCLHNSWDIS